MKKKKDYTLPLLLFIFIVAVLCSCNVSKPITGVITDVVNKQVEVKGRWFYVPENTPKIGDTCTFTPVKDVTRTNCLLISKN